MKCKVIAGYDAFYKRDNAPQGAIQYIHEGDIGVVIDKKGFDDRVLLHTGSAQGWVPSRYLQPIEAAV